MKVSLEYITTLCERFAKHNPNPKTELVYTNAYTLLVAVALSAQSTDKGVNNATKELFKIVHTPQDMLDLGEQALREHIRTIGLFNNKAKNIIAFSKILVDSYQGNVPNRREHLEKLPGVGRKTANVILNVAFGEPTIAVDTHIFRVAQRLGIAQGKTPEQVERQLEACIPDIYKHNIHHWLILHGRYICKARKPLCHQCFLNDLCPSAFKES